MKTRDIIGQRFGRLVVFRMGGKDKKQNRLWQCQCDCGNITEVRAYELKAKNPTKSCGCYMREVNAKRMRQQSRTHGGYKSPEYAVWAQMIQRCTNANHKRFGDYGGRSITICDRWLNSFENFLADMGARPTDKHTIERTNNDGRYEKSNCQWITRLEQARNKRNNLKPITHQGITFLLVEWAEHLGIPYKTLHARLARGWSAEKTLTTPLRRW